MKVGELCRRLDVPYRHVRYALEEGFLPPGVAQRPGRGEHRDLTDCQAYWLAVVLLLKLNGIRTPLAGRVVEFVRDAVRGAAQRLGWDHGFDPFRGGFATEHRWLVDIGDLACARVATTACPGAGGLRELPWKRIDGRGGEPDPTPVVTIRIDLAALAGRLRG